jgi:DNA processing protein
MAPETLLSPLTAITLLSLPGIGRRTAWRLLGSEPLTSDEQCLHDTLRSLSGVAPRYQPPSRETIEQARSMSEQTLACCDEHGIAVLTPGHASYPSRYSRMPPSDRPLLLYALGDLAALNSPRMMAVVGTRKPDRFARMATRRIAGTLAQARMVVVSGLALGCDAQAHEGSLDAGGITVAVLGCGLDCIYPAANTPLAERILSDGGCLVSEYPPTTKVTAYRLLERDRLQAGLADGLILAQSSATGGAMHAAHYGADHLTLPLGAIAPANNRPGYDGNEQLIAKRGAHALRTRDDVEKLIRTTISDIPKPNGSFEQLTR